VTDIIEALRALRESVEVMVYHGPELGRESELHGSDEYRKEDATTRVAVRDHEAGEGTEGDSPGHEAKGVRSLLEATTNVADVTFDVIEQVLAHELGVFADLLGEVLERLHDDTTAEEDARNHRSGALVLRTGAGYSIELDVRDVGLLPATAKGPKSLHVWTVDVVEQVDETSVHASGLRKGATKAPLLGGHRRTNGVAT
jgi:hypothetical protein